MLPGKERIFSAAWKMRYASENRGNDPENCGKNIRAELPGLGYEKRRCLPGNGPCCDYTVGPVYLPDRRDRRQTMRRWKIQFYI